MSFSTTTSSNLPDLTSALYSRGLSFLYSSNGTYPVKITVSIGKDSGRRWVLKKWMVKIKHTANNASSLCMI